MLNMYNISKSFTCAASVLLLSIGMVSADTKLKDGTVLSDKPTFIVTYIEAEAGKSDDVIVLLKAQSEASKAEDGNLRFETLQRINRDTHFVVLETWETPEARAAHAGAAHTIGYRAALEPMLYAPYDERPHVGLIAAEPGTTSAGQERQARAMTRPFMF